MAQYIKIMMPIAIKHDAKLHSYQVQTLLLPASMFQLYKRTRDFFNYNFYTLLHLQFHFAAFLSFLYILIQSFFALTVVEQMRKLKIQVDYLIKEKRRERVSDIIAIKSTCM